MSDDGKQFSTHEKVRSFGFVKGMLYAAWIADLRCGELKVAEEILLTLGVQIEPLRGMAEREGLRFSDEFWPNLLLRLKEERRSPADYASRYATGQE